METTPQNNYFQLSISNVPKNLEEQISAVCFDFSALGVSENLDFNNKIYPEPEIIEKDFKTLDAYFDKEPEDLIVYLKDNFPKLEILSQTQPQKDWLEEWKKGFHAFQIFDRFWVVPSWEKTPDNVDPIFIDPGMAFGTGTHETTQMCSELIFETIRDKKPKSLIDVGTGTGILAFIACKMGVERVIGTDNDPEAIRVAQENAINNKVDLKLTSKDLPQISETFDVVVANIIDGVLLKLKPALLQKMNSHGTIILSGIITENADEFIDGFLRDTDFKVARRIQKGEWVGYRLQKTL